MTRKLIVIAAAIVATEVVGALALHFLAWYLAYPAIAATGYELIDVAQSQYR